MIEYKNGNILESDTEVIVIPVNTAGVMGAGLALQAKNLFPKYYEHYKSFCDQSLLTPGGLHVYVQERGSLGSLTIVSFATKDNWKNRSEIEWIKTGLGHLKKLIMDLYPNGSVSLPKLGAGLGGLSWGEVQPLIVEMCESLPEVSFVIYE